MPASTLSTATVAVALAVASPPASPSDPVAPPTASSAVTSSTIEAPQRPSGSVDPFVVAPRHKGTWLMATGGVITASAGIARIVMGGLALRDSLCDTSTNIDACEENSSDLILFLADISTTPPLALGLGLLGGGLSRHGRWRAYDDQTHGRTRRVNTPLRERLGWGLLGSGAALWIGSMGGAWACQSKTRDRCFLGLHEGGFYVGSGLLAAGMALAPFSSGYNRQTKKQRPVDTVRISPNIGPGHHGVTVTGRF